MNIEGEEDIPQRHAASQNILNRIRKSLSLEDEPHSKSSLEDGSSPLSCHQEEGFPLVDEEVANNHEQEMNQKPQEMPMQLDAQSVMSQNNKAELIIRPADGEQANNFYCINEKGGRIGRHSNNEIVILEESVSRYHAIIEYKDDKFYLTDVGSTTGTFIKLLSPLIMEERMIIEMGSNQFYVEKIVVKDEDNGEIYLRIIEGLHVDKEYIIENTATIGRKGQFGPNTITLIDDLHLSNTHTKISYFDSKFFLEDVGSTNG